MGVRVRQKTKGKGKPLVGIYIPQREEDFSQDRLQEGGNGCQG